MYHADKYGQLWQSGSFDIDFKAGHNFKNTDNF